MQLTAAQELRRELLQFALSKQPEIEAAITMATRMEQFVLEGCPASAAELAQQGSAASGNSAGPDRPYVPAACQPESATTGGKEVVRKRRWSAEDDAQLTQMWHAEASLEEIAVHLNRTVPSLYSRARALGFARRDPKLPARADVDDRRPETGAPGGLEQAQIARPVEPDGVSGSAAPSATPSATPRRSDLKMDRYRSPRFDLQRTGRGRRGSASAGSGQPHGASWHPATGEECQIGVDPIIQFLRSRDYSVVRVEEGHFRLDGRRVLSVDQLRDKANKMRKSMGLPPFVREFAEPAE